MQIKRYVIEFGLGMDFHGQSVTKAAAKAVKDAVSRSCLSGLQEVLGLTMDEMNSQVLLKVTVAVTRPEAVNTEEVLAPLPIGRKELKVVQGGLKIGGIHIPEFGDADDSIESAIACIEVCMRE